MMRSNRKGRITVMNLLDHPVQLIVFLFLLSVLPLLVILGTFFLKISVVLALLRNALALPAFYQTAYAAAPNQVFYGDWTTHLARILQRAARCGFFMGVDSGICRQPVD